MSSYLETDTFDGYTCLDCSCHKECEEQVVREGYPQCDDKDNYFEDEFEVYEAMQCEEFLFTNYGCTDKESILRDFNVVDIQYDWREWNK